LNMNNSPITIVGNMTDDPEIMTLASGTKKASFSVAVPHRFNRNGEWEETTSFLNVVAWGYLADNIGPLEKGLGVIVVGRMVQRSYENDEGQRRYVHEVVADNIGINTTRLSGIQRKTSGGNYATAGARSGQSSMDEGYGPDEAPW